MHDALLDGVDAPTAVLSTQTDNEPAIALYAGRGWQVIVPHLDFGSGRAFLIMGKDLAADALKKTPFCAAVSRTAMSTS